MYLCPPGKWAAVRVRVSMFGERPAPLEYSRVYRYGRTAPDLWHCVGVREGHSSSPQAFFALSSEWCGPPRRRRHCCYRTHRGPRGARGNKGQGLGKQEPGRPWQAVKGWKSSQGA